MQSIARFSQVALVYQIVQARAFFCFSSAIESVLGQGTRLIAPTLASIETKKAWRDSLGQESD